MTSGNGKHSGYTKCGNCGSNLPVFTYSCGICGLDNTPLGQTGSPGTGPASSDRGDSLKDEIERQKNVFRKILKGE